MLGLFSKQSPLPESSVEWLFDAFEWSLIQFGSDVFYEQTRLITPSADDFPGNENSPGGIAQSLLDQAKHHAGLHYWPCRAVDHHSMDADPGHALSIQQVLQALPTTTTHNEPNTPSLKLFYEPLQTRNPQVMIANYAHGLAHHLGHLAAARPPCDDEQWPHMAEAVAIYLGFGVIMANTANPTLKGGCGGCRPSALDRSGFLSQYEASYALAIFCVLKDIPVKEATQHLKGDLKSFFKKCYKDVDGRTEMVARLKQIHSPAQFRGQAMAVGTGSATP